MKSTQELVFDLLEESGTNWRALKEPTYNADGYPSNHYGIYRSDNNAAIGNAGERYTVVQNAELATHLVETAGGRVSSFKGGLFRGGGRVFYQGKLDDVEVGPDTVKRYLTALNSHDGSSSIGFGSSNTVISCQNTFYRALQDLEKTRHTSTASERLETIAKKVALTLNADEAMIDNFKRMADTPLSQKVKQMVVADLFNLKVEDLHTQASDINPVKLKAMAEFGEAMASELATKGETLWGLFNAVTYKTNHLDAKQEKALESLMLGAGFRKNNKAYSTIVASLPKTYAL
jgi:phage/plasmid-like protein (TIGR03299 family)